MSKRLVTIKLCLRVPEEWTENRVTEVKLKAYKLVEAAGEAIAQSTLTQASITYWTEVSK